MSPEERQQWLEAVDGMFATHGWKVYKKYVTDCQTAIEAQWRSITPENLRFIQGRVDGLNQLHMFEDMAEMMRAQPLEELEPPPYA